MARRAILLLTVFAAACGESDTDTLDASTGIDRVVGVDVGPVDASDVGFADAGPDSGVDGGPQPCLANPDCASCVADGQCCVFSINCQAGSICNQSAEELYDPSQPADVCIRVLCDGPADCEPTEICAPNHLCVTPPCVHDNCGGNQICVAGECVAPPSVDECIVVQRGLALVPGATVPTEIVARLNGLGVPASGFAIGRSALPNVVVPNVEPTTAGATGGTIEVRATHSGLVCDGVSTLINYGPSVAGVMRVVVETEEQGLPIANAQVSVLFGDAQGSRIDGVTDAIGLFVTNSPGIIATITAVAPGFGAITVISPGTNDVVLALPRFTPTTGTGFYGKVDMSRIPRRDIRMGFVATALHSDLADLGLRRMLAPAVDTTLNAPELGFDNQVVELPEGSMIGLSARSLTDEATRCGGLTPGPNEVGCFLARAEDRPTAVFGLVTQLRLADLTSIASMGPEGLFGLTLASAGRIGHALDGYRAPPAPAPFVAGRPDYTRFDLASVVGEDVPRVLSVVTIDNLPLTPCDRQVTVLALVALPGRGLVPLGIASAQQELDGGGCRLSTPLPPFQVPNLGANQIAISIGVPHQGAENHPIYLAAIVSDGGGGPPTGPLQLLAEPITLDPAIALGSTLLAAPRVDIQGSNVDFAAPPSGQLVAVELETDTARHRIYASSTIGANGFTLPALTGVLSVADADRIEVSYVDTTSGYPTLFTMGSGTTLERPEAVLRSAATTTCPSADCTRQ